MKTGIIASSYMRGEPFVIQAVNLQGVFNLGIYLVGSVKIDWGDGNVSRGGSSTGTQIRFTNTYTAPYNGIIRVFTSYNTVILFSTRAETSATGNIYISGNEYNKLKNLTTLLAFRTNDNLDGDLYDINIPSLQDLRIKGSGTINENLVNLTYLGLYGTGININDTVEQIPDTLVNLKTLRIENSTYYVGTHIPETLTSLEVLGIFGPSDHITSIPNIAALKNIDIRGWAAYQNTISSIPNGLISLENIRVEGNNTIPALPTVSESPKMKSIYLTGQNTVTNVPEYPDLESLHLRSDYNILPTLPTAPKLTNLNITEYTGSVLPDYPLANNVVINKSAITSIVDSTYVNMGVVSNGQFALLNNTGLVYDFTDFGGKPAFLTVFNTGGNVTYSGGMSYRSAISAFQINANLSSSEVDLFFNELDTSGTMPTSSGTSYIRFLGEAAAPTSASATARANLTARGFVISHN